jgi:transposase-like protein
MTKKTSNRCSPEVRQRAVRMVLVHGGDHAWQWAAIGSIAAKIGLCGRPGSVQKLSRLAA